MSRYADPLAVRVVPLGACQCPGTPHETDEATVRYQVSGSALARIGRSELERVANLDPFAAWRRMVLEVVTEWNLLWLDPAWDGKGERKVVPIPVTEAAIELLDSDTLKTIAEAADELIASDGFLPNGSGAPSVASSPESASPTPKKTRRRSTSSSPSTPAGLLT